MRWCDPQHLTDGETAAQTDMTGLKSHRQELAFKARSMGCRSHTFSPQGPRATLVTCPEPSPTYLLASWIPLRVVVPSRLTNSRRLLSVGTQGKIEAEWGSEAREPPGTVPLSVLAAHPGHQPPHPACAGGSPSVLLPSVKSWLCMIFSTMSSASMRVSSTQVGWLSTESFFLLGWGESQNSHTTIGPSPVYRTQDPPSARGRWSRVCSLNRHINPTVRMLLQPDFREEAAEALGSEVPASKRPQSMEAGWPQGMLDHPKHPPTEHARQARCSQCGASAGLTATHPRTTGPSCPCYKWRSRGSGSHWRALLSSSTCGETYRNERSDRCGGRGGRGGFSGGRCSRSLPSGPSTAMLRPPEVLLLVDVFRRCVRSERLEERDCSVL